MTRRNLMIRIWLTVGAMLLYAAVTAALFKLSPEWYNVSKDLVPLSIAAPAAYLGYVFQRRMSYLQSLRQLWHMLIPAVHRAIIFANSPKREANEYCEAMMNLGAAIDALRGVFANVPKSGSLKGLYPFENLKDIYRIVEWIGCRDDRSEEQLVHARACMHKLWQEMHGSLLLEFDRDPPIQPISKYLHDQEISVADKLFQGTLTEQDLARESAASHPAEGDG